MSTVKQAVVIEAEPLTVWAAILEAEVNPPNQESVTTRLAVDRDADGRPDRITCEVTMGGKTDQQVVEYAYPQPHVITSRLTAAGSVITRQDQVFTLTEVAGGTRLDYQVQIEIAVPLPGFVLKPLVAKEVRALCERIKGLAEGR